MADAVHAGRIGTDHRMRVAEQRRGRPAPVPVRDARGSQEARLAGRPARGLVAL